MTGPPRRTGTASLPLHHGRAPRWLFERMVKLAREITIAIVGEYGPEEMLLRLSHPHWFQAFGCVLGFDWHSSGVTTTLCGAVKEGIRGLERELGLFAAGGKGATSRRTPSELVQWGQRLSLDAAPLVYASRMSAKVDNSAVQDGYQLYHHTFLFTARGSWAVVQQGMNDGSRYARRYHWLGDSVADFVNEPHSAIAAQATGITLNLVAGESAPARQTLSEMAVADDSQKLLADLKRLRTLSLPAHHPVGLGDIRPESLSRILPAVYERQPEGFEQLLGVRGVGPKTLRALTLIAELVHGVAPSYRDPARYSFAHGGKDGYPYPVDRETYGRSIELLAKAVQSAKLGLTEKRDALNRLGRMRG